jgi:hypothetical protein
MATFGTGSDAPQPTANLDVRAGMDDQLNTILPEGSPASSDGQVITPPGANACRPDSNDFQTGPFLVYRTQKATGVAEANVPFVGLRPFTRLWFISTDNALSGFVSFEPTTLDDTGGVLSSVAGQSVIPIPLTGRGASLIFHVAKPITKFYFHHRDMGNASIIVFLACNDFLGTDDEGA